MMAGYSILVIVSYGGYAFFQAHKNLKSIYLTFGYVGVAHGPHLMDGLSTGRSPPRRKRKGKERTWLYYDI